MAIFADYRGLPASARGASVALGNFDGLHAGHRAVMEAARKAGQGKLSVANAVTGSSSPRGLIRSSNSPSMVRWRP